MIDTTYATTPPTVGVLGVCGTPVAERTAAPWKGAAASTVAISAPTAVRLRVPMTGLPVGAGRGVVITESSFQLNSTTPGDLPPRDPLS